MGQAVDINLTFIEFFTRCIPKIQYPGTRARNRSTLMDTLRIKTEILFLEAPLFFTESWLSWHCINLVEFRMRGEQIETCAKKGYPGNKTIYIVVNC